MYELSADKELCKGCACVITEPCFMKWIKSDTILVSDERYEEEEVRKAISHTIDACPQGAVKLKRV